MSYLSYPLCSQERRDTRVLDFCLSRIGGDMSEDRMWEISRVMTDCRDATLDEAIRMAKEAESLGVPCSVEQSTVWGGWTITPKK